MSENGTMIVRVVKEGKERLKEYEELRHKFNEHDIELGKLLSPEEIPIFNMLFDDAIKWKNHQIKEWEEIRDK